jgi:hypothetical protein
MLDQILVKAADETQTLTVLPLESILAGRFQDATQIIPRVLPGQEELLSEFTVPPPMVEIDASGDSIYRLESTLNQLKSNLPGTLLAVRIPYVDPDTLLAFYHLGVRIFHLTADYHGRGGDGRFVIDLIREVHMAFVEAGCRDEITLIGSGGIAAAEHVPKAILCGLDLVALDTPLLVALQARFEAQTTDPLHAQFSLPQELTQEWGVQRLQNLVAAWRDQLLEILGAMGLREVRRLRGEMGRAMFQVDLEREAFAEIEGYLE